MIYQINKYQFIIVARCCLYVMGIKNSQLPYVDIPDTIMYGDEIQLT